MSIITKEQIKKLGSRFYVGDRDFTSYAKACRAMRELQTKNSPDYAKI